MSRQRIGRPGVSPQGGHRITYLEVPDEGADTVYRLVTEEPDGTIVQEFYLTPEAAYDLFEWVDI